MAKYTPEQQEVIDQIKTIGRKRGEGPKKIKAALLTGKVETNFRNLPYGDADSQGWRQERASIYRDPTNLTASINRFYDETDAVGDKYARAGDLAAAVQRPAARYRGRYQANSAEGDRLLGKQTATPAPASSAAAAPAASPLGFTRKDLLQQYLAERGRPGAMANLQTGLATLASAPKIAAATAAPSATPKVKAAKGDGELLELFWQGQNGINVKRGKQQPMGFVQGHTNHVHVATGPKTTVQLGKLAQDMGLTVGENPSFGKVNPVHVANSYHYKGQAIDVTGSQKQLAAFAKRVARLYRVK